MRIPKDLLKNTMKVHMLDEGMHNVPYLDTKMLWTVGIGHLIGRDLKDLKLSDDIVFHLYEEDIDKHWGEAVILFGEEYLTSIEPARQVAILSLVFTLGRRKLSKFFETLPALQNKDWAKAATLLMDTKWASDVDPNQRPGEGRDDRIAYMLRTGKFHEDYKIT